MKVRILAGLAGTTYQPGEVRDLPDDVATQMIAEGSAEPVSRPPKEVGSRR